MFDHIKLRWKLRKLYTDQDRNTSSYNKRLGDLRARSASQDEVHSLHAEAADNDSMIQLSIAELATTHWLRKSERRFIPSPERRAGLFWEKSLIDGRFYLTSEGVSKIRKAVREEVKASREMLAVTGAAATGIIGSATGLIAVLLK